MTNLDYRPRRNRSQTLRKIGLRAVLVMLLVGGVAVAVVQTIATGPLAWQWVQKTLLTRSTPGSSTPAPPSPTTVTPVTPPPAPVVAAPKPDLVPVPTLASAHVASVAVDPDPVDPAPETLVHDLWAQGLTAESQRHFAVAVNCYEQILSYPNTYWPATLNVRLRLAREEVAGGTR